MHWKDPNVSSIKDSREAPITHKMDSFQAVPKKAIVKKNNNKNPLFQDAKVEQIKKYWIIIPHTRTPQFTRTVRKVNVQNSIRSFSVTEVAGIHPFT